MAVKHGPSGDYEFRWKYIRAGTGTASVPVPPVIPPIVPDDDPTVYLLTEGGGYLLVEDSTRIVVSYT